METSNRNGVAMPMSRVLRTLGLAAAASLLTSCGGGGDGSGTPPERPSRTGTIEPSVTASIPSPTRTLPSATRTLPTRDETPTQTPTPTTTETASGEPRHQPRPRQRRRPRHQPRPRQRRRPRHQPRPRQRSRRPRPRRRRRLRPVRQRRRTPRRRRRGCGGCWGCSCSLLRRRSRCSSPRAVGVPGGLISRRRSRRSAGSCRCCYRSCSRRGQLLKCVAVGVSGRLGWSRSRIDSLNWRRLLVKTRAGIVPSCCAMRCGCLGTGSALLLSRAPSMCRVTWRRWPQTWPQP